MKLIILFLLGMASATLQASQASFKIHPDPEAKANELKKAGRLIAAGLTEEVAKINSKNVAAVIEVHLHDSTNNTIAVTSKLKVVGMKNQHYAKKEKISFIESFFRYTNKGRRLKANERYR